MSHLKDEELVEHYYNAHSRGGNGAEPSSLVLEEHLEACAPCARAFSSLESDLADMPILEPPARGPEYGETVWRSIAPSLAAYEKPRSAWKRLFPALAWAAACVLLVAGAFFAGRISVRKQTQTVTVQPRPSAPPQHVVVVVLGDHLDRSERFLVELKHADADNTELARPLSDEARSLLAANHICRKKAEQAKDPELNAALDHLDQLLGKLANQPGGLNPAALAQVKKEMQSENLLFEVRVLRSRVPAGNGQRSAAPKGGTA